MSPPSNTKRAYKALEEAVDVLERAKPYLPSGMVTEQVVPLLKELRGIILEYQVKSFKISRRQEGGDTVPQHLLDP